VTPAAVPRRRALSESARAEDVTSAKWEGKEDHEPERREQEGGGVVVEEEATAVETSSLPKLYEAMRQTEGLAHLETPLIHFGGTFE
jgi:hypothetical protein